MPRIRVLLDANTIVSGLLFEGNEAQLLELGMMRALELVTSQYVLEEVRRVLSRKDFGNTEDDLADLLGYFHEAALIVADPEESAVERYKSTLRDSKDACVCAAYEMTGARYLVTGDRELLDKVKGAIRTRDLLDALSRKEM